MHISDLHDYAFPETEEAKEFLSSGRKKALKREIEQIVEDEFERLEDYANEYISQVAASRAERFVERVLDGDEDAAAALLGNSRADRYRTVGYDEDKPWCHLIRGSLFETGGIRLRRQIVEAHADLLRTERILDLEAIVDGLSQQVRQLERSLEEARDRCR